MNSENNDPIVSISVEGAAPRTPLIDDSPPYVYASHLPAKVTGMDYNIKLRLESEYGEQLVRVLDALEHREYVIVHGSELVEHTPYMDVSIACDYTMGVVMKVAIAWITQENAPALDTLFNQPVSEFRASLVEDLICNNPVSENYEKTVFLLEICDNKTFQFEGHKPALTMSARLHNLSLTREAERWRMTVAARAAAANNETPSRGRDIHATALQCRRDARASLISAGKADMAAAVATPRQRRVMLLSAANNFMEAHEWTDALRAAADALDDPGHHDDTQDLVEMVQEVGRRMNYDHRKGLLNSIEARIAKIPTKGGD